MKEIKQIVRENWVAGVISILALLIMDFIFDSVCYSTILFGIPCPGCGITRATKLLLTGHVHESLQMHPLLFLVILGVILYPILRKNVTNYTVIIKTYVVVCAVIFIGFYIYRMYRYYPNLEPMVYRKDNYLGKILTRIKDFK